MYVLCDPFHALLNVQLNLNIVEVHSIFSHYPFAFWFCEFNKRNMFDKFIRNPNLYKGCPLKRLFSYITLHYEKALEMRGFFNTNFFVGAYYMRMHITPLITPLKIINFCRILCLMLFSSQNSNNFYVRLLWSWITFKCLRMQYW